MLLKTALAVLLFSGIVLPASRAQVKNDKPATNPVIRPEDTAKAPAAPQDFSREAYVIEKYDTTIKAEDDGNHTSERTAEIRIMAEAGVKAFAVLSFTYSSAFETVDVDYVRVRKPDGSIVKTPDYNFQDMPGEVTRSAPIYSDIHEKHVAVKGLAVGDVLEYLVRYRTIKPEVPGQFWFEDTVIKDAVVKSERLEISVPAAKYVKVVSPDYKPDVREAGGRKIYTWTHSNLSVPEKDPKELPLRTLPPPSVQITTFHSWEEVGQWYGSLQKDPLEVTPALQAKAAELTKGLTTNDAKIRAIYNFVSLKFHYIGLDFGIGRYQPHAADDVLGNGYGDCKDKHTLMASLLKAAGIEAWPALINASRKLDPDVPSPSQFNHVITVVPSGDNFIWLDTTPEVAPYQLLMPQLRNQQALVIPVNKPAMLMTTPAIPPEPQEQRFTVAGKLDDSGTFTGHFDASFRGDGEISFRMAFRQLSESQWKEGVQRLSYALGFAGEVSNVVVSKPDETDKPITMSYDYVRKNYSDWENHQFTPPIPPMGIEQSKDEKKPREPILLGAPGEIVYESKITLPPSYSIDAPMGADLVENYAEYHSSAKVENGVLTTKRRLVIKKTEVPLDRWESYRDFGKAVSDDEFKYIVLHGNGGNSTNLGASTGHGADLDQRFQEASEDFRRGHGERAQPLLEQIIKQDPNYPKAHLTLGTILLGQNKVDRAIAEWHKEQDVSPADESAYSVPALYLTDMGRKDEAIAEWRKLLKVHPDHRFAPAALGALLNQEGKYAEAAEMLETAAKIAPDNLTLLGELGSVYIKLKQRDKAIAMFKQVVEKKGADPETLNNVAYVLAENKTDLDLAQQYGQDAVSKLDADAQGSASSDQAGMRVTYQFALTWDTLGWIHFQKGDVERAARYVRSAWLLGQHEVVGEHLGEIYEKQGKLKEAAHTYELALAALSSPSSRTQTGSPQDRIKQSQERQGTIEARYRKLTGHVPANEIHRLPDGEWTLTTDQQLKQIRQVKLRNEGNLTGVAQFVIVFEPGKAPSAQQKTGDDAFEVFVSKLAAAKFQVEFPPDSGAILVRWVLVDCHTTTTCTATLDIPLPEGMNTVF